MSILMFSAEHLAQVLSGEKNQTRRLWDSPRLTPGKSYRAVQKDKPGAFFTPREDAPAYVLVEEIWEEKLGDITLQMRLLKADTLSRNTKMNGDVFTVNGSPNKMCTS